MCWRAAPGIFSAGRTSGVAATALGLLIVQTFHLEPQSAGDDGQRAQPYRYQGPDDDDGHGIIRHLFLMPRSARCSHAGVFLGSVRGRSWASSASFSLCRRTQRRQAFSILPTPR